MKTKSINQSINMQDKTNRSINMEPKAIQSINQSITINGKNNKSTKHDGNQTYQQKKNVGANKQPIKTQNCN